MTTPAYLNAITSFLEPPKSNRANSNNSPKVNYWRPGLGTYKVRFVKLKTEDNTPILSLLHYDKPLVQKRINAPVGWGLPDPINEQFESLRQTKEGWAIAKFLRPKRCFYAGVLVRGEEDKGVQIWEVKEEFVKALYNIFLTDDNKNEDLLDYNVGYDFDVKIVPAMKDGKPKMYEGKPCKTVNAPVQTRKSSPLASNKEEMQRILATIPDYFEQQKRWLKSPEDLIEILEQFMVNLQETTPVVASSEDHAPATKRTKASAAVPAADDSEVDPETDKALDDAFGAF